MAGTIKHEWTGTVLTITSDSGTSSCDLKGEKGDDGPRGAQGKPGDCVATDTAMLGGVPASEYALKSEIGNIDLDGYATTEYVDNAIKDINIPETDLSDYYTKTETDTALSNYATTNYVDNAIKDIDIPETDLTNYALKTDIPSLNGYATEEYVDNAINDIGGGSSVAFNLLDNSNFKKPINQRGQTSYTGNVYSIDRWKLENDSTLIINENSITVTGNLKQYIEGLPAGKTLTFAYGNDTVKHIGSVGYETSLGYYSVSVPSGEWTWAALYEGEFTAETLPPYMPKSYAAELLECQRYFYRVPSDGNMFYTGFVALDNEARVTVYTPVPMRTTPSLICDAPTNAIMFSATQNAYAISCYIKKMDRNGVGVGFQMADKAMSRYANTSMRWNSENVAFSADL